VQSHALRGGMRNVCLTTSLHACTPTPLLPCLQNESLRIGVKYKPEKCDRKTKDGDSLKIHYTGTCVCVAQSRRMTCRPSPRPPPCLPHPHLNLAAPATTSRCSFSFLRSLYKDGSKFDSSRDRNDPFEFTLGRGMVIKGWDEGLGGMCVGEKRKLIIPSGKGYGAGGSPPKIPGGATLVFETELIAIN
jgi:FK506-binding protein 2